jgi:hypothetical protein
MAFEIVLSGVRHVTIRQQVVDLVGLDRVASDQDQLVVVVPDQPAAIGVLNAINDLGCELRSIRVVEG